MRCKVLGFLSLRVKTTMALMWYLKSVGVLLGRYVLLLLGEVEGREIVLRGSLLLTALHRLLPEQRAGRHR